MTRPEPRLTRFLLVLLGGLCALGLGALAFFTDPVPSSDRGPGRGSQVAAPLVPGRGLAGVEGRDAERPGVDTPAGGAEPTRSALRAARGQDDGEPSTSPERLARLRVTAADGGALVPGVELERVWDEDDRRIRDVALTGGSDGILELRWRGGAILDIELGAPGFERVTVVDVAADPAVGPAVDPAVDPAAGPAGGPAAVVEVALRRGVTLTVSSEGFEEGTEGLLLLYRSLNADGRTTHRQRWELHEALTVEVSPGPLSAVLVVPGMLPSSHRGLNVGPGEQMSLVFTATEGERMRGRVVEKSTRQPLAGVKVQARPAVAGVERGKAGRLAYPPVVTGDDGRFEIEGLPLGPLDLSLAPGFGPPVIRRLTVTEGEAVRTRDLAIGGAAAISGRVRCGEGVDPEGLTVLILAPGELGRLSPDPAKGGAVLVDGESRRRGAVAEVLEDGSFRCETAPAGRPVGVLAQAGAAMGFVRLDGPLLPGEEREGIELELTRPDLAVLRVVNDLDEPVSAVEISARLVLTGSAEGGVGAMWSRAQQYQDAAGRFETGFPADAIRRVRLSAEGHLPLHTSWPMVGGAPAPEPTLQMVACSPLELLVLDEYRFAVKGARIEAWPDDLSAKDAGSRRLLRTARCDGRGRATLELDRAVGDWIVRARASGHRDGEEIRWSKGRAGELRMVLQREPRPAPASISGRLVRLGDGSPIPGLRFGGLRGGVAVLDGADFELKGIRPGRVQIVAEAPGYERVRLPVDQLEPGQAVEISELHTQTTARVRVTVSDRAGNWPRKAKVRLLRIGEDRGGRQDVPKKITFPAVGDAEGGFEHGGVPRTRWLLAVDHPQYARFREIVAVRSRRSEFEVTLQPKKPR